eukprot:IDg22772t1
MTGSLRRKITPFLWVSLMGLQPGTAPDEDLLLQSALALNKFQILVRGINLPKASSQRTIESIQEIQQVGFNCGLWLSRALDISVSTKIHRCMRHIADHLLRFGCGRRGDTDRNETMHKDTKDCIDGTNRKLPQIAVQLLTMRTVSSFCNPIAFEYSSVEFDMEDNISAIDDEDNGAPISANCDQHLSYQEPADSENLVQIQTKVILSLRNVTRSTDIVGIVQKFWR